MKQYTTIFLAITLLLIPVVVFAQSNLVLLGTDIKCSGADCGFDNFLLLVQGVLSFIIKISIPVAAAMFIYAGFLYVTAVDNSSKVSKAKDIFITTFWGFVIILGAWVIVYTIVIALVEPSFLEGNSGFFRFLDITN